jgi:hypothetical protein
MLRPCLVQLVLLRGQLLLEFGGPKLQRVHLVQLDGLAVSSHNVLKGFGRHATGLSKKPERINGKRGWTAALLEPQMITDRHRSEGVASNRRQPTGEKLVSQKSVFICVNLWLPIPP